MHEKSVSDTVPATPKKVASPQSVSASQLAASATPEESESDEDDENQKPRGQSSFQN